MMKYMKAGQRLKEESSEAILHDIAADDAWECIKDQRYRHILDGYDIQDEVDASGRVISDADPGL